MGRAGAAGLPLTLWSEMGLGTPGMSSFGVTLECVPGLCCLTPARLGSHRNVGPAGFSPSQSWPSASGKEGSAVWLVDGNVWTCRATDPGLEGSLSQGPSARNPRL